MAMFAFPYAMTPDGLAKTMPGLDEWMKGLPAVPVSPLMMHPLAGAAAAAALGAAMTGHAVGLMAGTMQGAAESAMRSGGRPMPFAIPGWQERTGPWPLAAMMEMWSAGMGEAARAGAYAAAEATRMAAESGGAVEDAAEPMLAPAPAAPKSAPARAAPKAAPARAAPKAASPGTGDAKAGEPKAGAAKAGEAKAGEAKARAARTGKGDAPAPGSDAARAVADLKSAADDAAEAVREVPAAGEAALEPEDYRRPAERTRPQTPDDLKRISGVGPKLESVLNGLGIWTFAQIAEWTPQEVAWLDDYLQFKGRIDRDDWIGQARTLAAG